METLWVIISAMVGLLTVQAAMPTASNTTLPVLRNVSLPTGWKTFCDTSVTFVDWHISTLNKEEINNMIQVSCALHKGAVLNFVDFRLWTANMTSNRKVALQVSCSDGAAFRAPWPMKANNLVFLRIRGCTIEDYFMEYFDPKITKIKNAIRVMEIKYSVIPMNFSELMEVVEQIGTIVVDAYCGPLTAEKAAFNGIVFEPRLDPSFGFPPDYEHFEKNDHEDFGMPDSLGSEGTFSPAEAENIGKMNDIGKILDKAMRSYLGTDIGLTCSYDHLVMLDESISSSLSSMDVIKRNSRFKALLIYNLSSVGFIRVPSELINWRSYTHFPKLKYLDLSHNFISDFDFADYDVGDNKSAADGPGIIDLRNNNITQLSKKTLESLSRLRSATVLLENNPLDCSCENVSQLLRFLKTTTNLGRYEYLRRLQCASPRQYRDRRVEVGQLTESQVCPDRTRTDLIILCSALGATVLLFLVASVLLIHFRRELVIIAFTRLRIKLWCRKPPALPMKMYDVFISSCDEDREWVRENVINTLDNFKAKSFNICLRENWEFGVPIADMAAKSVDTSEHTLAVISRHFLRDEWRHFEFSLALHQSLKEKRRHLVVIFREDVPNADLLPDMRKYVATTPCIHFNRRLYKDRLIYALCHDEKNNPVLSARSSAASSNSDITFVSLSRLNSDNTYVSP